MNAKQAREVSELNLKGSAIAPMMDHFHHLVKQAAEQGRRQVIEPFSGRIPIDWSNSHVMKAVWIAIQNEGYEVNHHSDPDPGHPCSHAYTTVSW